MKKLCLCLCGLLLLAGCQNPAAKSEPPATFDEPTFYLSSLPEIEPYQPLPEIISRYYQEYREELAPAADYGHLYPYIGRISGDKWVSRYQYGLADEQGRIVVDPVYDDAYYVEEGAYLILRKDAEDDEAKALLEMSEGYLRRSYYQFALADGSWVSPVYYGDNAYCVEEGFLISQNRGESSEDIWDQSNSSHQVYDWQGRLLYEGEGYYDNFWPPYEEEEVKLTVDYDEAGNYFLTDVATGQIWQVEGRPNNYSLSGGGWSVFDYYYGLDGQGQDDLARRTLAIYYYGERIALLNLDTDYEFEYCYQIKDDLFALNYYQFDDYGMAGGKVVFYQAKTGESREFLGQNYFNRVGEDLLILYDMLGWNAFDAPDRMKIYRLDLEPAFDPHEPGFVGYFSLFRQLTEDVYQAGGANFQGLLHKDGRWLLRLNIGKNLD